MTHTYTCEACGQTLDSDSTPEQLAAEEQAFADQPETPMASVCETCWKGMREAFPTLDARYKLQGL